MLPTGGYKTRLYAGTSEYPAVLVLVTPVVYGDGMSSDNRSGADNQQGRPQGILAPNYVVGFVDGEGCFCVSIRPHPTVRYGSRCVIGPVFQIYQHRDNLALLERLKAFFGCGTIASKGPQSDVMTYAVSGRRDLESAIIPFFERYPLQSTKQDDFVKFRQVVLAMHSKAHRTDEGFRMIVMLAFSMNKNGKQRKYKLEDILAEPSETVRRASVQAGDDPFRSSWRHEEGGRNDRPATQLSLSGGNRDA